MTPLDHMPYRSGREQGPRHHPSAETMMDYATGALGEAESLLVAAHLTLCPQCRRSLAAMEEVGGALLEVLPGDTGADAAGFDALMARLDCPEIIPFAKPAPVGGILPAPIRHYVGGDIEQLRWRRVMSGLDEVRLNIPGGSDARLLRVGAGKAMPRHTHEGNEMTLVLVGAFHDVMGHFQRGDVAGTDEHVDHQPVADAAMDCVCLAVTDAPLRLTGWFGRLINPFVRY